MPHWRQDLHWANNRHLMVRKMLLISFLSSPAIFSFSPLLLDIKTTSCVSSCPPYSSLDPSESIRGSLPRAQLNEANCYSYIGMFHLRRWNYCLHRQWTWEGRDVRFVLRDAVLPRPHDHHVPHGLPFSIQA